MLRDQLPIACILAILAVVVLAYTRQLVCLQTKHRNAEYLLPMCKTIADALAAAPERARVLRSLENSHFRSVWLTVFSADGEVWADSYAPCYGKLPMRASESQSASFRALRDASVDAAGVLVHRFGRCPTTRSNEKIFIAGVRAEEFVVCMQACGAENF